jgi:hypothetical protein
MVALASFLIVMIFFSYGRQPVFSLKFDKMSMLGNGGG